MTSTPQPPITRHIVGTIDDLPRGLWDQYVAVDHPFRSSAFFAAVEATFPQRTYAYLRLERPGQTVGLAALTLDNYDFAFLMPNMPAKLVRSVRRYLPNFMMLRLAMVGTMETAKQHWWWDKMYLNAGSFADHLIAVCEEVLPRAHLLIVRDFSDGTKSDDLLKTAFLNRGFRAVANLPLAVVDLPDGGIEKHLCRLRGKPKAAIRKQLQKVEQLGLRIERVADFEPLIDECYPLYLQVHAAAHEFKRAPYPKQFFREIAHRFSGKSTMLTIRVPEGQLIGWILTGFSKTVSNPFLIGLDYRCAKEMGLYYNLIWSEVRNAAEHEQRIVDLGITSYFIKQTMGAKLESMSMAARVEIPWLRSILGPLLPALLSEKPPKVRNSYRNNVEI